RPALSSCFNVKAEARFFTTEEAEAFLLQLSRLTTFLPGAAELPWPRDRSFLPSSVVPTDALPSLEGEEGGKFFLSSARASHSSSPLGVLVQVSECIEGS